MTTYAWRRSLLASLSALAVSCGMVHAAPHALAATFDGIPGHAPNGTYGFDANPDFNADPLWEQQQIATAGEGYGCYRIPALNTAPDGAVLASYDGRPHGCGDAPTPNAIVQRRSTDNGQSWSAEIDIAPGVTGDKPVGYSDPSYVVDRETGDIFNFHVKSFDQGIAGSQPGTDHDNRNIIQAAYAKSQDGGKTWTYDHVVTRDITTDPSWRARFATSGNGIQLTYGEHKGRLIQPAMIIVDRGPWKASAWISDDHGETWYPSKPWGTGMDENKIVELSNGVLMNNSRSSYRSETARKISYSYDGGYTWTEPELDPQLPDPRNNASIIRAFPNAPKDSALAKVLLFSNSATTGPARTNGTIRMSCDDGQTWPVSKEFNAGDTQYTNMTTLENGNIGIMWEDNVRPATNIYYANFNLAWLGASCLNVDAKDQTVNAGDSTTVPVTITNTTGGRIFNQPLGVEAPEGFEVSYEPATVSLDAGESTTVNMTVKAPLKGTNGRNSISVTVPAGRVNAVGNVHVNLRGAEEEEVGGSESYVDPSVEETTAFVTIKNPKKDNEWHVGDTVDYEFTVLKPDFLNNYSVVPSGSALEKFAPPASPNCRWSVFTSYVAACGFPTYTITEEDLARGYFETETTWTFTNLTDNTERVQKLMTPRVNVVEKPETPETRLADTVKADIEPVGEVSSAAGDVTVAVKVHAASNTETLPEDTKIALYLDEEEVAQAPVVDGVAEFTVTVPSVPAGAETVTHMLAARPVTAAENFRGIDGFGRFMVLPRDRAQGRTTLTLSEQADVRAGSVEGNRVLVSAKLQRNGEPVAGEKVTFTTSSGNTASDVTNADGVALTYIEVAELGQLLDADKKVTITATVDEYETTTEVFDSAQASHTFTVTAEGQTDSPEGSSEQSKSTWAIALSAIAAVLALLSPIFSNLIKRFIKF
ncbi:hypothetical protein CPHO_04675 [Corynebacterium phocae]|uniref:exo-alpha-sialidase n=1 Tax=Corynebacterium phocae TaxID=161895 RepID=A0A1L7D2H8_9CORY|nr:exo-alpha-sialidase [Corynebacterium phocae]APT92300.1 hypothetical protein CPHO_04675 [Corynebacterium phocae]